MPAMQVMVFREPGSKLGCEERPVPSPGIHQVLIKVLACAVCRTDLHVQDGELPDTNYPIIPGHQVVGKVIEAGAKAVIKKGQHVGAAWLGWTCGECRFCTSGRENLCDRARFHGHHIDGGYAEYMLADARFCFPLSDRLPAAETTPLLCAGLIGYRTLNMAGDADKIGVYGFGSAAHIVTQIARHQGRSIYAFTRPGDKNAQAFARESGAVWAGSSSQASPEKLDAALIFAPAGELVPKALKDLHKGGCVVCGGIHMTDIPSFPYADLWEERQIRSVANLTREDGQNFMSLAENMTIRPQITTYSLDQANDALDDLRHSRITGTAVLLMNAE
jgi:propanol-preferring alcohol dehydrogenase